MINYSLGILVIERLFKINVLLWFYFQAVLILGSLLLSYWNYGGATVLEALV